MAKNIELATSLSAAFAKNARLAPQSLAVAFGTTSVTKHELDRRTNRLARTLSEHGVEPGSFVTIALPNGLEFLETVIAVWKLGAIPQPISNQLPAMESTAILDLVDPTLVVGLSQQQSGGRPWLPSGYSATLNGSRSALTDQTSPAWKAPTSGGSTGRPKIIVAGEAGTVELLSVYQELYRMAADTVMLSTGPLYHNGPFNTCALALLGGGSVIGMERFDAQETLRLVQEHRVTWLYLVPTMMSRISRLPTDVRERYDLSSLRTVLHTAAPCPAWLKREWIDWLGAERIVEIYGGTEAQAMTMITGTEWLEHPGSVGKARLGEISILDHQQQPCPAGEIGGVWMRRDPYGTTTYTYLGADPVRAAGGWEWLGDNGYLNADGYLFVADRSTDMVLVGGANVYPAEVEAALDSHPAIESSCVVGLPQADLGNTLHAVVHASGQVCEAELRAHMAGQLAPYKLPRSYEFVTTPLRDDAGKVRRSQLRTQVLGRNR